jgi:hypothetical protein
VQRGRPRQLYSFIAFLVLRPSPTLLGQDASAALKVLLGMEDQAFAELTANRVILREPETSDASLRERQICKDQ